MSSEPLYSSVRDFAPLDPHEQVRGQEGAKKNLERRLSIRLSHEDYAFLDYVSKAEGLKPSQVVRTLILKFLRYKKRQNLTSFAK